MRSFRPIFGRQTLAGCWIERLAKSSKNFGQHSTVDLRRNRPAGLSIADAPGADWPSGSG